MRKFISIVLALAAVLVLFAGCGGEAPSDSSSAAVKETQNSAGIATSQPAQQTDNSAQPAAGIIEPEQLISKEEAESLIGAVKDGMKNEQAAVGQKLIAYESTDGSSLLQVSITQQAFMTAQGSTPESIYMSIKDAVADASITESVEGIDEYFFGTPGLHILYKNYYIVLACGSLNKPETQELLKQAAGIAFGNLKALIG